MPLIRRLSIRNFRSIQSLEWCPEPGINCLVGPGDSGKSTVLDAIDLCLGARRAVSFGDTDFFGLSVESPIVIAVTLGALPPALMDIDLYGNFLRGFDLHSGAIEDEPRTGLDTVLTLQLQVGADLEPLWTLFSERAQRDQLERFLPWKERVAIAPARIGSFTNSNLSWSRGSVLNRITEDRPELGAQLAAAARNARASFGAQASPHLSQTLTVVQSTARELGVSVGAMPQALLDAHAVSIGEGAIALHNEAGIPLRSLGTGSSRLLVAGLQRAAAVRAPIALVDEVEHGLEPHRLTRFLDSLGAKDTTPPLQAFLTTHSPVALRELSGNQLTVLRAWSGMHSATRAGNSDEIQSTLRSDPEAFLARSVIVCEGASEVGFARGLDQFWVEQCGVPSFFANGGAYVNAGGGSPDKAFARATALRGLGYRVMAFIDADKPATPEVQDAYAATGGEVLTWRSGQTLEDEMFQCLDVEGVTKLLAMAWETVGPEVMNQHLLSRSENQISLAQVEMERAAQVYSPASRKALGAASRIRGSGWFKSLTLYQHIGRHIVGPALERVEPGFKTIVSQLWTFTSAG